MQHLSTKELNYIKDIMSWELLAAKKCFQYANQETNPAHRQLFSDTASIHQQNYTAMLSYLDRVKTQGGQTH